MIRLALLAAGILLSASHQALALDLRLAESLAPPTERIDTDAESPAAAATGAVDTVVAASMLPALRLTAAIDRRVSAETVVNRASALIGTRYQLGADSGSELDCSALVGRVFHDVGVELPRTTRELLLVGREVDRRRLRPGDLMFYRWQRRQLHVAVYAGNGEILHASSGERQVTRTRLNPDWNRRLLRVRRLI